MTCATIELVDVQNAAIGRTYNGKVNSDDPWYHFVANERWRIVTVDRADTTTDGLDDDPNL